MDGREGGATDALGVVAGSYGVITALSPFLQARRMRQTGHSRDVSILYLLVIMAGTVIWMAYGLVDLQWPIVIPNAIGFVAYGFTIVLAAHLRTADDQQIGEV